MTIEQLRPHKTILSHRPSGRRYIVIEVLPQGVALAGLLGGDRRIASGESLKNADIWGIEYA